MKYEDYFADYLKEIEKKLEELLPAQTQYPSSIHEAMRYTVFPGGKRFRPVLTLAACEAAGGRIREALIPAVSVELIHSYSLVHDDLPALDNDEMRRGKWTCHKRFGEAAAILAGDGLLNLAYEVLAEVTPASKAIRILAAISTASGTCGMIGGQVVDLETSKKDFNVPLLDYISSHKTGKLIAASAVCGGLAAEAAEASVRRLQKYGEFLGLAFQLVDDLHDGDGYLHLIEAKAVVDKVRDLIAKAKKEIRALGARAERLHRIADFLLEKTSKETHALDR